MKQPYVQALWLALWLVLNKNMKVEKESKCKNHPMPRGCFGLKHILIDCCDCHCQLKEL